MQPRLQLQQQLHDLRLNRDVQRRHGFVGDDERRVERQRARDADALPLAAAELVRIARRGASALEPDQLEQLRRPARAARLRAQPWMISGSSTMSPTRMRGLSEEYGS